MQIVYRYKSGTAEYIDGTAYVCIGCLLDESAYVGAAVHHGSDVCRRGRWPFYERGHDRSNRFATKRLMERHDFEDEKDLRAYLLDCLRRHCAIQEENRNFSDWLVIYHPERFAAPVVEYTISGDQSGGGVLRWEAPDRRGKWLTHEEEFADWKGHVGDDWRAVLDRLMCHHRAWETPSLARAIVEARGVTTNMSTMRRDDARERTGAHGSEWNW